MPALPSSPATFTWISTSAPGAARAVAAPTRAPPSGSGARRGATSLTLRLCSAPMKSHSNRSRVRSCLAAQLLGAVLPHQLDAALGERGQVVGGDVLDRGQISTSGRRRRAIRSRFARDPVARRAAARHAVSHTTALAAGHAVVAAVGEEQVGAAARAQVDVLDLARRRPPRSCARRRPAGRACGPSADAARGRRTPRAPRRPTS